MRKPISLRDGDLVAIRTRQRNAHVVGRIADAHQGVYLVHRHVRGTTLFAEAVHEVSNNNVEDVVHADETQTLSDGMERLWAVAEGWYSPERTAAPHSPAPMTHRMRREELEEP